MKIGLAHNRLDLKRGTERDLYRTAEELRDLGHEVHLFCQEYGVEPPLGTYAHRVWVPPLGRTIRLWSYALRAPTVIRQFHCDVVVSFGRLLQQDVLRSGGGCHKMFLERMGRHGGAMRRLWQNLSIYHRSVLMIEQRQFGPGGCKKVIAISGEVQRELMALYGVPASKILVLYNGVDLERFHPTLGEAWRAAVRTEWGIPMDAAVVLFVGSGFERKGLDRLLRVWHSPTLSKAFLLVVGEDARIARYKALAERQAPGKIIFAGGQERIERFYGAADIVVLPSVSEPFGNVVLEALACGFPVVVSRNAGAAELLKGSLAGVIVEAPDDGAQWEAALERALQNRGCSEIKKEARRIAESHSWNNHFRQFEACLAEVCQRGSGGSLS